MAFDSQAIVSLVSPAGVPLLAGKRPGLEVSPLRLGETPAVRLEGETA